MKNMTFENIAKACGGELVLNGAKTDTAVAGAVLDSRLVEKDYLFFATVGERVDGHDYIAKAFEKGAILAVCQHIPKGVDGAFVVVEDTFVALKQIAKFYRENLNVKVVGITGSVGKTSTKEMIASVLAQKYKVLKTEGNFNNEVGLPLTVLRIRDEHEVAVLEMGISDFGEMTRLSEIARPDVCVITNIGQCHLEQLGDRDGVLKAKTEVFANLRENGKACLFAEDDKLAGITEVNGEKPCFYGMSDSADIYGDEVVNKGLLGSECVIHMGEVSFKAQVPLPGKHMIYNALAATAVGKILGLHAEEIQAGIRSVEAVSGRSHIVQTKEYTLIDDCYNANPVSMKAAVDLLGEAVTRKVAILGDMFELGENEKELHCQVGAYAAGHGVDALICVGALSENMYQGAADCEDKKESMELYYYATLEEAMQEIDSLLQKDDAVLIKASHGMHFENMVKHFTDERTEKKEQEEGSDLQEKRPEKAETAEDKTVKDTENKEKDFDKKEGKSMSDKEEKKDKKAVEEVYNQAVSEAEATVEAGDENKKWYVKHKKAVIITVAVLVVLIAGCITGLILYNNYYKSLTQGIVLYQNNGAMMSEKLFKDAVYSEQGSTWNFNEKGEENNDNPSAVTTDGKYIYFAQNHNGNQFDLYYAKKGSSNAQLIATGVTDYEVVSKGELYYASGNAFYQYQVKDAVIQNVCSDVNTFMMNEKKNAVLLLGGSDGILASMTLNDAGSLTTLETGVTKIVEASGDLKTIVYEKADGLYMLTVKEGEKVKITKEYTECHIYNIDKKCEVYYLTEDKGLYYYKQGEAESEQVTSYVWKMIGADSEAAMFFVGIGSGESESIYMLVNEGEAIAMKDMNTLVVTDEIYFDTSDKKAYFIGYDKEVNGAGTLYSMGYQMLNKGKVEVVENNVISIEFATDGGLYLGKDDGSGNVDLYHDGALVARNILSGSVSVSADGRAMVFAYRVSDADGDRTLAVYNGKTVQEVGSCVGDNYCVVSEQEIYFLQNGENGYDLVKFNGRKIQVQVEGVENFHYLFY